MSAGKSLREKLQGTCYYKILDVTREADEGELKKSYRRLALKWHPDKNKDDKETAVEMFRHIAEAFEVLSDPEKRRLYDMYGKDGVNGTANAPRGGVNFSDAADLFDRFFGNDPFFGDGFGSDHFEHFFGHRSNHQGRSRRRERDPFGMNMDMHMPSFFGSGMNMMNGFDSFDFNMMGSGNSGGSFSQSTRTTTRVVNGHRVTTTETTTTYPDGRTETKTSSSGGIEDREHTRNLRLEGDSGVSSGSNSRRKHRYANGSSHAAQGDAQRQRHH